MARVVATGGVPRGPGIGQGFQNLGQQLLAFSQLRQQQEDRQRGLDAQASLNPIAQAVAGRLVGTAQDQTNVVGAMGPQQPQSTSPGLKSLAGMDPKQLASAIVQNPQLLSDPKALTSILMGDPGELVKAGKDDTLFQRDPTTGALTEVATGRGSNTTFARVVSGESPLNEAFSLGIPAGENARVEFERDRDSGEVLSAQVKGRFGSDTVILPGEKGEDSFQKRLGEKLADQIDGMIAAGHAAASMEEELTQASDLLAGGVQTGNFQEAITGLQGFADDIGIDIGAIAEDLGVDIGNLRTKQEFDRVTTQLIISGFDKFKGNLNQKEVELAQEAFANFGRSEGANIDAVASFQASQVLSRERGIEATKVQSRRGALELSRARFDEGTGRFKALKEEFRAQMEEAREAAVDDAAVESATTFTTAGEIAAADLPTVMEFVNGLTPEQFQALPQEVINAIDAKLPPLPGAPNGNTR